MLAVASSTVTHLHARALVDHTITMPGQHWLYRCISHGPVAIGGPLRQSLSLIPHDPLIAASAGFVALPRAPLDGKSCFNDPRPQVG